MKDFAGTIIDVSHGLVPSTPTAVDGSCSWKYGRGNERVARQTSRQQSKQRVSNPHEVLGGAAPATEEPARPHIPEPYDAQLEVAS